MFPAENVTDGIAKFFHRVAQPPGAKLPEIRQILAELSRLNAGRTSQGRGAYRLHAIFVQLTQTALVD